MMNTTRKKMKKPCLEESAEAILENLISPKKKTDRLKKTSAKDKLESAFAHYFKEIVFDEEALVDFFVMLSDKGNYGLHPETEEEQAPPIDLLLKQGVLFKAHEAMKERSRLEGLLFRALEKGVKETNKDVFDYFRCRGLKESSIRHVADSVGVEVE